MASTEWTGVYRVTEDTTGGNTARAIFATTCDAGVLLPQGTYWLDWQADGDAAYSGPWIMPVTINGQTTTGNAMQYTSNSGNWGPAQDGGTLTGQDFPFLLLECAAAPVCPYTITVSPATIPTPVIDIPYSVTFTATGGVAPYAFSVAAGTLPDGLTLDPVTGELSGTPTTDADYTFTIMATDDDGCTGTLEYTVSTGAYDLILFDDAGRAWACVNSATGDWSWTDAQTVQTFTGTGLISLRNGVMNIVSMPGEPWSLTIRVYTRFGIAYGSFIYRAFRIRSSLNDRDILNNPDFCN